MASKSTPKTSTANLGFELKLWLAADKLRNHMDAAEPERSGDSQPQAALRASGARQYNHVVLDLIFLSPAKRDRSRASVTRRASRGLRVKYIPDSFHEHHGTKAEVGMQNEEVPAQLPHSFFSLRTFSDIRRKLIEADLVDTALRGSAFPESEVSPKVVSEANDNMVALPGQLFYSTQIPVRLWFLTTSKAADAKRGFRTHQPL
jgi:hypothetical protein